MNSKIRLNKNKQILLASIPFLLIIFLRFGVGADYFSYYNIYYTVDPKNISTSFAELPKIELGFKILVLLGRMLHMPYHLFIGILASVILLFALLWIKDSSPNIEMSVLLYFTTLFLFWNLSAIRQGLVITISIYIYLNENKKFPLWGKLIASALLSTIHVSALIVPAIVLVTHLPWKRNIFIILFLLFPTTRLIFTPRFFTIFENIPQVSKLLLYADYDKIKILSTPFLLRFGIFSVVIFHYDVLKVKFPKSTKLINFILLNMLLYFYIPFSKVIGTRTTIFGYYTLIVVFALILDLYKNKRLYPFALSGLLLFNGVQFYNEVTKQMDRTGYELSINQFNFETIFQKNYKNFSNRFAFNITNDLINKEEADKLKEVNNNRRFFKEATYDSNLTHLSVKFPDGNYGIINEDGKVVEEPNMKNSVKIFGEYIQERSRPRGEYMYSYNRYRKIGENLPVQLEEVLPEITTRENDYYRNQNATFFLTYLENKDVAHYDIFDDFNKNTIWKAIKYNHEPSGNLSYLRIMTEHTNYFALLNKDDEMITNKLYSKITPFDETGIAIAYTDYTKEYINSSGTVIWIEIL